VRERPDFVAASVAVWVDRGYDREFASDGRSRYGFYLRERPGWFADLDPGEPECAEGDRVRFAQAAWTIANGPIMAPPLVLTHPRVLSVTAQGDEWDWGHLLVTVELVSALPACLGGVLRWPWQGWAHDSYLGWHEPDRGPGDPPRVALPTLAVVVPVPAAGLPVPGPVQPVTAEALGAVEAVAAVLNAELRPVLAALDSGGAT
jgi:hypothetical protein